MEKKKKEDLKKKILFLANKILDPDPAQLEKWDPHPHQNVLDPPNCCTV